MRQVSQVFITKVLDYALKFATTVLIARFLGPADKGVLTFAQLVVGWVITFGNLSIYDANIFLLGSRRFGIAEAAASTVSLSAVSGLIYAAGLIALVSLQWVSWPVGKPVVLYLLALTIPFSILMNNAIAILQGLNLFKSFNIFTLVRSLTQLLGVVVVILVTEQRLLGFVIAGLVMSVVSAVALAAYLGHMAHWRFHLSMSYLKEAYLYGIRGHLRVLLVQFTLMFDQFVLGAVLAPTYLGWYSVAVALSAGLLMMPDSVAMVLFPRVAADPASAGRLTARACSNTLLMMVVSALAALVLGRPVIGLLYGEQFLPAATPFYLLLAAIIFQAASRVLRNYLYGMGRPQLTLCSAGAAALVTVLLTFPLVKQYGMIGAAVASLLAHGAGMVVDLVVAARLSTVPMRAFILPQKADLRLSAWKP